MKRVNRLLTIVLLGVGLGLSQWASALPIGPGSVPAITTKAEFLEAGVDYHS